MTMFSGRKREGQTMIVWRRLVLFCFASLFGLQAVGWERPSFRASKLQFADHELIAALRFGHDGYSLDEVLIRDDLRIAVLASLAHAHRGKTRTVVARIEPADERRVWHRLLNLRKAGKLPLRVSRRGKRVSPDIFPVAEMAARTVLDRHRITVDGLLVDPRMLRELDQEARQMDPNTDRYAICKAVLGLRKRRKLKPELVLRVADWDREIQTHSVDDLKRGLNKGSVPSEPGVYLFRGSEGYLYIGEAKNLRERLRTHLEHSDRVALGKHLAEFAAEVSVEIHRFDPQSPGGKTEARRAYESELIRSRQPRFNVRP
ncbi:MAG: nucleotide excision repair endonuclease [Planctomycetota bacterium]